MATTLPPSMSLLADAARVARASGGIDRAHAQARPESAPDPHGPAVVNHVRGADETAKDSGVESSSPENVEEEHADELRELAKRDAEVRAHEQAHAAAGGAFAGAPSYSYTRGPDGRNYAVSGEVPIDVSAISGDPEATIQKMQQVKRAALAPRDPSDADRAIAATADAMITAARRDQTTKTSEETSEAEAAGGAAREAFGAHARRSSGTAAYAQV